MVHTEILNTSEEKAGAKLIEGQNHATMKYYKYC